VRGAGLALHGIDFSPTLIAHARAAIPEGTFTVAEAFELPEAVDAIVSFSVFQYFPDFDYARRVVAACRRAAPVTLVLDVPDLATRAECDDIRRRAGSKPGDHLYYPRSFFEGARTWTNDIPGYENGPFRFNALLEGETRAPKRRAAPTTGGPTPNP
jgi:trans-aconitate methyltransferase